MYEWTYHGRRSQKDWKKDMVWIDDSAFEMKVNALTRDEAATKIREAMSLPEGVKLTLWFQHFRELPEPVPPKPEPRIVVTIDGQQLRGVMRGSSRPR